MNYITLDEAEDYIEYRTVENLTDINLEVDYTEEFNQMNLQTGNIIEIVLMTQFNPMSHGGFEHS